MNDRNIMDRWCRLIRISPNEDERTINNSWSEKSTNLLSTERKIYAIKVSDGELETISFGHHLKPLKKKKKKNCFEIMKKWIEKSKLKLPKVMILFSVLQLFFHVIGPLDLAYQTLAFSPVCKLELWRYFTYSLLHTGAAHLWVNIILQLIIGLPLESEVGHLNVMFCYLGGILSGSLMASISPDFSLMVGASSGIYSLLMSHVSQICMNFSTISYRTHRIIFVTVLSMSDIIYAIIHCLENREPQIAVRSHIAGALSGVMLGFMFYHEFCEKDVLVGSKFKLVRAASFACLFCFVVTVVIINVMKTD